MLLFCGTGRVSRVLGSVLGGSWRIPCYSSSRFWHRVLTIFRFSMKLPRPLPPVAGGMAMAFVDDLFLPLRARPCFLPLFLTNLVGFVASPFRGVGVGFEEPHLRLMF